MLAHRLAQLLEIQELTQRREHFRFLLASIDVLYPHRCIYHRTMEN